MMFPVIAVVVAVGLSNKSTYADRQVRLRVPAWDNACMWIQEISVLVKFGKVADHLYSEKACFAMPGVPFLPIDLEGDVGVDMNVDLPHLFP